MSITNPRHTVLQTYVVSGASAGVPGAWVEVVASTLTDFDHLVITSSATAVNNTSTSMLLDIGIGAAGNEDVYVEHIAMGFLPGGRFINKVLEISCPIPAGTRVAYRIRGESTRLLHGVDFDTVFGVSPHKPSMTPISFGADPSTCSGVVISNPPNVNEKGAWTEVIASTPVRLAGIHVGPGINGTLAAASSLGLIDIGVGDTGVEEVVALDIPLIVSSSETVFMGIKTVACDIPAGSRVSARYSRTATQRLDLVLHGVPA